MKPLFATLLLLLAAAQPGIPADPPDNQITLRAGKVLDGRGGAMNEATVVIEGSRIAAVETRPREDADVRPARSDADARRHRHPRPHRLAFRPERQDRRRTPERAAGADHALRRRERLRDAARPASRRCRASARRRTRTCATAIARGVLPGPRMLTSLEPIADDTGDAGADPRGGAPGAARRRRRDQDLRLEEHPRRRRADDERRSSSTPPAARRGRCTCARPSTRTAPRASARAVLAGCTLDRARRAARPPRRSR